jgi:Helix-turn-helix domain
MFTDQLTRAIAAARTTELADDIADRIAAACHPDELDALMADAWAKHRDGRITANDLETLQEAALVRMNALPEGGTDTRPKPRPAPSNSPRAACRRPSRPREKLFGNGRPVPLDREAKCRIMVLVKALMHPTEPGKHWGEITAKARDVFEALLWGFHNARNGLCFPSYQTIAAKAGCAASTVAEAIKMLEAARILTWCNRRARVRIGGVVKVIRVSNSYRFLDPGSKSEFQFGTRNQDSSSLVKPAEIRPIDPEGPLERAITLGKKAYGRA